MEIQYREFNELLIETRFEHIVDGCYDPIGHSCETFKKETRDAMKQISRQLAFLSFSFKDFLDTVVIKVA